MWGIIPAAGNGARIQPLAFSKELLPVGARTDGEPDRPRAVSEYLLERMVIAGADKVCFVISPLKSDILRYYGGNYRRAHLFYAIQSQATGLCDAIFRALPLIGPNEPVIVGLPDTIWFPDDALQQLPDNCLSLLLFPVTRPELFDAVLTDEQDRVHAIEVKARNPGSRWVWGALKMPGATLAALYALWRERGRGDEYIGTLITAWLQNGGEAWGVRAGSGYVDVGTLDGYREAIRLLAVRETHA